MTLQKPWIIAAALLGAAGITLALPALPALGQASTPSGPIKVLSPATITDKGAVVMVPIRVVCPAGDLAFVSAGITERSGNGIAEGGGGGELPQPCTGGRQTVKVAVTASNKPFVAGTGFAQASLTVCDFTGCFGTSTQGNVTIVKAKA